MKLDSQECRRRVAGARVARLGTVGEDGRPHLVPVTFAVEGDVLVVAVDHKPKSTTNLRRLRNVVAHPEVAFLVDEYTGDWDALWWVRVDAQAIVVEHGPQLDRAVSWLVARYPQYRLRPPLGPVIWAEASRWSGWSAGAGQR